MRRTLRPTVALLEGRALLTGFTGPIHSMNPPGVPAGVTTTVAVDAPSIAQHGTVTLSLVETNTTGQSVTFTVPASKLGFQIYEGGVQVWKSPVSTAQTVKLVTLAPGQSMTIDSATWDDTGNVHTPTASGTFTVTSNFAPAATPATVTVGDGSGTTPPSTPVISPVYPKNPPKIHRGFN